MKWNAGVVCVPDHILRYVCVAVDFDLPPESTFRELTKQAEAHSGTRLAVAAPQIGVGIRAYAVNSAWMGRFGGHSIVCNPHLEFSDEPAAIHYEGCLSIPGRTLLVARVPRVTLTAQTVSGEKFTVALSGTPAKIAQHEQDHLNGLLITDRASEVLVNGNLPRPARRELERAIARIKT